jgi:hypothetical protein
MDLIGIHDRIATEAVTREEGRVAKHTGDGILASLIGSRGRCGPSGMAKPLEADPPNDPGAGWRRRQELHLTTGRLTSTLGVLPPRG